METLWFAIVAFSLTMYVILDGFDLGAGIIHLFVAKTERERAAIIKAIGPVWDGNEVWLLAAGGSLYLAFPLLYASSFSGFYLPLMMVLWFFILRGLGIELRHQFHNPLWVRTWDILFSISSTLLAIFLGAALGNVLRGVPLNQEGYFFTPLWTTFTVVPEAGVLDWYTVLMGLVALTSLTLQGANYIVVKTEGDIQMRARTVSGRVWWAVLLLSILAQLATFSIHPEYFSNYSEHPWGLIFPLLGLGSLVGSYLFTVKKNEVKAFLGSSVFIGSMLAATAFGLYPTLLPASTDPALSLTVQNVAAQSYSLNVALVWWILGIILACGYFVYVYRSFRGKVSLLDEEGGY